MTGSEDRQPAPLIEALTRREREVLALLAEGNSAPEIAAKLTVALSSVKTHIQNLYGKLGVNSKRQAVSRARELGLLAAGAPAVTAPVAPPLPKQQLPVQVTQFFGREAEIEQIKQMLAERRLVTLTGAGGVGKTRLSLRVAEEVITEFRHAIWFVPMVALSDAALVPQQIALNLGVREEIGQPILDSVAAFLRNRSVLLVLDNCEHLIEACAQTVDRLLRNCPALKVLATSREALRLEGEAVFPIQPLAFPAADARPSVEQLSDFSAVRLLVDRARLVLPEFKVTPQNAAALATICRRLDGIPLALELAASRMDILSATDLAVRMDDAFALLTKGSRTALPRHQTLRAMIDWSYALLDEPDRVMLQRLSVFAGGCTLAAAEAVCADPDEHDASAGAGEWLEIGRADGYIHARPPAFPVSRHAPSVLPRLGSLAAKSMLVVGQAPGEATRYRLLETVRQYAREKLSASGEGSRLDQRHCEYYLWLSELMATEPDIPERREWADQVLADADNVRQAMHWSLEGAGANLPGMADVGPRLVCAMFWVWHMNQERAEWNRRGLEYCRRHPGVSPALYARLLGLAAAYTPDPAASLALARQAVDLSVSLGAAGRRVATENWWDLGDAYLRQDRISRPEEIALAQAAYGESEALLIELGPSHFSPELFVALQGHVERLRAYFAIKAERYAEALPHARASVRLFQQISDGYDSWWGHFHLADALTRLGDYDGARNAWLEALRVAEDQVGDWGRQRVIGCCFGLGTIAVLQGDLEQALGHYREAIRRASEQSAMLDIASGMGLSASLHARMGQPLRAARLAGMAHALYAAHSAEPWEDSSLDTILPGWRDGPEAAGIQVAFDAGQAMTYDEAVSYALDDLTT